MLRGGSLRKQRKRVKPIKRRKRLYIRAPRYQLGHQAGYDQGNSVGYVKGWGQGITAYSTPFDGTSIIIPTYNQLELLKACIESIQTYTPELHEIIVIDNGSTDGTSSYLNTMADRIRSKLFPVNLGFAGGTNQGLMMARGTTLMMLNNDTVVTHGWLTRLLECLRSQSRPALVGPVTNYISGDQLIDTNYRTMAEMHAFAGDYHQANRGQWRSTGRLTGFCVLFTRESFRRIGYMDEGFVIGNCEDDDFGHRAKLLGHDLIIAANTFIHHEGSKTIKTLDRAQFDEIYGNNLAFYSKKWGETSSLLSELAPFRDETLAMTDYYPEYVIVQGPGIDQYWIEGGIRYPVESAEDVQAVRLSQTDLWNWPVGDSVSQEQLERKLEALTSGRSVDGVIPDGSLIRTEEGLLWQLRQGTLHRIHTELTFSEWKLESRSVQPITNEEAAVYRHGKPILAPPRIKASNI